VLFLKFVSHWHVRLLLPLLCFTNTATSTAVFGKTQTFPVFDQADGPGRGAKGAKREFKTVSETFVNYF